MKEHILSKKLIKVIDSFGCKKSVYLHEPEINNKDFNEVAKCLKSSHVSTASIYTNNFEKKLQKYLKCKYVVATINGTSALQIAIRTLGISEGSEIFIPNLNYVASSNATLYNGCIPHFVDIDVNNLGINFDKLEKYIKKNFILKKNLINKKTKRKVEAIIPTHIFGNSIDIKKLLLFKKKYKLKIIEDASESLGSFYNNKHLGTFGDIGVLSFNGNKIITTGGGGAILTNNKKLYKKGLSLSKISRKKNNDWTYDYESIGFNYRMPGLNASLGISQLNKLNFLLNKKKKIFQYYEKKFSNETDFKLIHPIKNSRSNHWLNSIIINKSNLKLRNRILKEINKKKISVRPIWKLMKKINYLSRYPSMDLKNSAYIENKIISLPSSPNLL